MSAALELAIEGVGLWSPELPGWGASADWLAGRGTAPPPLARPAPALLAATERRRAPDSVLLALEVAAQACAMAGREPRELPNVFASAYGDLAINDYLCATLARAPQELSPTKFHNSVHNAASGYWCIATGCGAASSALSAGAATFGAGLLEAAVLASSEQRAVLFVVCDTAATGPLADVIGSRAAFAAAFVLAPPSQAKARSPRLTLALCARPPEESENGPHATRGESALAQAELARGTSLLHAVATDNPATQALPLLRALATRERTLLQLAAGPDLMLRTEIYA